MRELIALHSVHTTYTKANKYKQQVKCPTTIAPMRYRAPGAMLYFPAWPQEMDLLLHRKLWYNNFQLIGEKHSWKILMSRLLPVWRARCGVGWKAAEAWLSSEIWQLLHQLSNRSFSPVFVFMETKYVETVLSQMFILNVVIALGD